MSMHLSVSYTDTIATIRAIGSHQTLLVQGHMGTGKSSMLTALAEQLPSHTPIYFDCTTKDLGDLTLPNMARAAETGVVEYATNAELGLHLDEPIILMLDELGKANPAVKNGLMRLMLERTMAGKTLHPDSIVFATTNLGVEGVGDLLQAHQRNRVTVVEMRKPTPDEWLLWAINKGLNTAVLSWVKDTPQVFQDFRDMASPEDNLYVFHPRSTRTAFCTPRSLEAAANIVSDLTRAGVGPVAMRSTLAGTIGVQAALDLAAYIELAAKLPRHQAIIEAPEDAPLPDGAAATCMVVYRALQVLERADIDDFMTYLKRLSAEAQGLFMNGVRAPGYRNVGMFMTNKSVTAWVAHNKHMFAADV